MSTITNIQDFRSQKKKEKIDKYWERTKRTLDAVKKLNEETELMDRMERMEETMHRLQQFLLAHDDELELTQESIKNIKNVIVQMHKKLDI
jgi:predicted AlkP superfamily phosphohydrolase/phosphomutase